MAHGILATVQDTQDEDYIRLKFIIDRVGLVDERAGEFVYFRA